MSFPESQRVVFRKNPLVEVICQLRFPTVLAIAAETPSAFQERVRQLYPHYEKSTDALSLPAELSQLLSQMSFQLPSETTTHKFLTEDRKRFISLTQEFVSVTEQAYTRWEVFRPEVESAEAATREVYRPVYYSRVGLRYRNVIDREKLALAGVSWDELLSPFFAGMLASPEVRSSIQNTITAVLIALGDADAGFVQIQHGFTPAPENKPPRYLIDADFFRQGRCTHEQALTTLDQFHRRAGDLFRWATTPGLQHALEPAPTE